MRTLGTRAAVLGTLALSAMGSALSAQTTATQLVTFRVMPMSLAALTRVDAPLSTRSTSAAVRTGSLALSTNQSNQKITASLDRAMPGGTSLSVAMTAPTGARSAGRTTLDTDATDVLTAIPAMTGSTVHIVYAMLVGAEAPPRVSEQRLVTYTILTAP